MRLPSLAAKARASVRVEQDLPGIVFPNVRQVSGEQPKEQASAERVVRVQELFVGRRNVVGVYEQLVHGKAYKPLGVRHPKRVPTVPPGAVPRYDSAQQPNPCPYGAREVRIGQLALSKRADARLVLRRFVYGVIRIERQRVAQMVNDFTAGPVQVWRA